MSKTTSAFSFNRHRPAGINSSALFSPSSIRRRMHGHAVVAQIQAAGQPQLTKYCLPISAVLALILIASIAAVMGILPGANGTFSAISNTTRGATVSGATIAMPPALTQRSPLQIKLRHLQTQPVAVRAELFNALGVSCLSQGDTAGATECFQKAVATNPLLVAARNNLGTVLLQAGNLQGARAAFQATLELQPDNIYALRQLRTSPAPR